MERLYLQDRQTLYPLGQAYMVLSRYLRSLRTRRGEFIRDDAEKPKYVGQTELRTFPFSHKVPFLDVLPSHQEHILDELDAVSRRLKESVVHKVRNDWSHFKKTPGELSNLDDALEGARAAIRKLESLGFVRISYRRVSRETNTWGRSIVTMKGPDGEEVSFVRPSPFQWLGLPWFSEPQYIMRSAVFGAPNEVLRFTQGTESGYSRMWDRSPSAS